MKIEIGRLKIEINAEISQTPEQKQTASDIAYCELNNLYLAIERGIANITITNANRLRFLVGQVYEIGDPMRDWWESEFQKLPHWMEV